MFPYLLTVSPTFFFKLTIFLFDTFPFQTNPNAQMIYSWMRSCCSLQALSVLPLIPFCQYRSMQAGNLKYATDGRTFWSLAKAVGGNFCLCNFPLYDPSSDLVFGPQDKAKASVPLFVAVSTLTTYATPPVSSPPTVFLVLRISTGSVNQTVRSLICQNSISSVVFKIRTPELAPF